MIHENLKVLVKNTSFLKSCTLKRKDFQESPDYMTSMLDMLNNVFRQLKDVGTYKI